jgi:NTE family protein
MSDRGAVRSNETEKPVDLVFEGGGVKGIGLVGAYDVLEKGGYRPVNVAGTSAGAIVAALVAAGYSANELYEKMVKLDFREFRDKAWEDRIPLWLASRMTSMLKDQGIYEGKAFFDWISGLLKAKGVERFGDLIREDLTDSPGADISADDVFSFDRCRYRYKLQVIVSDVTERQMLRLPCDANILGYPHPDNLPVDLAVRMSMSIPIFFEPVRLLNQYTSQEHILVDGGMLSNFPVWLFDAPPGQAQRPTIGIKLAEPNTRAPLIANGLKPEARRDGLLGTLKQVESLGYLLSLVETMMEAHDRLYVAEKDFDQRTIGIDPRGVGTMEFDLSEDSGRVQDLFESGQRAAKDFLPKFEREMLPQYGSN